MIQKLLNEVSCFNVIDIGCRGNLNEKWDPIEKKINLHGFDPDKDECERLTNIQNNFKSVKYHPFAVAGYSGIATLYKTRNQNCYSLLKPDTQWLRRFSFFEMLEVMGDEKLEVSSLSDIEELKNLDLDIIKIDAQGLELEILKGATELLDQTIYAETESGFTPNYINESTQAQVDEYMRSRGFLLFDLILSRMPHNNIFKNMNDNKAMLLWSESIWMRDYITLFDNHKIIPGKNINREKSIKALTICAILGYADYGLELAKIFCELGLLNAAELENLKNQDAWKVFEQSESASKNKYLNFMLRLFPSAIRTQISYEANIAAKQKHILKPVKIKKA